MSYKQENVLSVKRKSTFLFLAIYEATIPPKDSP